MDKKYQLLEPVVGIVIPCYNEEEIIKNTHIRIFSYMQNLINEKKISKNSFLAYVDDGSNDSTFAILNDIHLSAKNIRLLKFSRNFGHQSALLAGLNTFYKIADCLITIDADLQDDIEVIGNMIDSFKEGNQIVFGVRKDRSTDSFSKKTTANFFYKLIKRLGVDIINNHADFRLASNRVLEELEKFSEVNLFLRGIFPALGFQSAIIYYNRKERIGGETKYPLKKMLSFAWDGITSFSVRPLRIITVMGFIIFGISLVLSAYVIFSFFFFEVVHGWASIALPIYFIGGIQLLSIGIVGEYIGKIYKEVKRRPRYIIEKIL